MYESFTVHNFNISWEHPVWSLWRKCLLDGAYFLSFWDSQQLHILPLAFISLSPACQLFHFSYSSIWEKVYINDLDISAQLVMSLNWVAVKPQSVIMIPGFKDIRTVTLWSFISLFSWVQSHFKSSHCTQADLAAIPSGFLWWLTVGYNTDLHATEGRKAKKRGRSLHIDRWQF